MSDSTDEELATDVEQLADVLSELREQLRPRRGPLGLPAPPTPGELLRFTDEQAIPFAIAVLEANVRALELLQGAIRLVQSGREADAEARRARDRAASLSRRSLERLEGVLSDLEENLSDGELPRQAEAREVLSEARRLRDEVEEALAERADGPPDGPSGAGSEPGEFGGTGHDDGPTFDGAGDGEQVDVDVEGELRTIKEELGKIDESTAQDGASDDDASEDSVGEDATADAEPEEKAPAGRDEDGDETSEDEED